MDQKFIYLDSVFWRAIAVTPVYSLEKQKPNFSVPTLVLLQRRLLSLTHCIFFFNAGWPHREYQPCHGNCWKAFGYPKDAGCRRWGLYLTEVCVACKQDTVKFPFFFFLADFQSSIWIIMKMKSALFSKNIFIPFPHALDNLTHFLLYYLLFINVCIYYRTLDPNLSTRPHCVEVKCRIKS